MVNIVNIITNMLFIYNMPNLPFFRINLTLKWNFCGKMMANGMVFEEKLALITTEDDTNQPEHFHYSFYRRFHSNDEKAQTYLYALFYFIDFLLKVPADLQNKLERNIVKRLRKEDISMMEAKRMEPSPTLKAIIREYAKTAEEQGLERGLEKGIKQTTVKFAKKLIDKDYSNEFVAEMTGLLQEEIEAIRKS